MGPFIHVRSNFRIGRSRFLGLFWKEKLCFITEEIWYSMGYLVLFYFILSYMLYASSVDTN